MQVLAITLLAFVAWSFVLLSAMLSWRGLAVLTGKRRMNEFPAGERHGSDTYWRLSRAHLNSIENIPVLAALAAAAALLEQQQPGALATVGWLGPWSAVVLGARVCQSAMHVASGSALAVTLRFSFFAVQIISFSVLGFALAVRLLP